MARNPNNVETRIGPGLARACFEGGYREYAQIDRDPILAELKSEPRYRDVLERMRHDLDAQRARAAERRLLDLTNLFAPTR